ncbi:MAG: hypothetical protein ACOC3J_01760, partial [Gemmatimonadota bacterium]
QESESDPSRLYGRLETTDGSVYEGFIRWDRNEAGWYDVLHADKPIPERNRRDAERLGWEPERTRNRIEVFGIGITLPDTRVVVGRSAQSGIRFGHISALEVRGSSGARLLLKSGEEVELRGGGDLGASVDDILVDDRRGGLVELNWRDIRVIDFFPAPPVTSGWGQRVFGTLRTRDGAAFTGYIVWDMDELYGSDVLDGDERGRDREIPFSQIRGIERLGSDASRVLLAGGEAVVLRGSNDVDHGNRDIMVADPALGEVRIEWEAFDRVMFERPPSQHDSSMFSRAGRLRGTVYARGGETHTGWIRWDNDEEFGWELLDGELVDGVELDVEFGTVRSIERAGSDAAVVTLRDGRSFELTGSNDVDAGNRGIYVERSDGTLILVRWERFERVEFDG